MRLIHIFVDSVFATPEDDDSERHLARVLSAIQANTMKETLRIIQHRISCTAQPYLHSNPIYSPSVCEMVFAANGSGAQEYEEERGGLKYITTGKRRYKR